MGGYVGPGRLLEREKWARRLRLGVDVSNVTDARPEVTDRNGMIPSRFKPHYLDPIGRTATLTLRKLL